MEGGPDFKKEALNTWFTANLTTAPSSYLGSSSHYQRVIPNILNSK